MSGTIDVVTEKKINHIGTSHDTSIFLVSNDNGIVQYTIDPFEKTKYEYLGDPISMAVPLSRTYFAFVGSANNIKYPTNKVLIYNADVGKIHGEMKMRSPILAVKLCHGKIVVVLDEKIYVYELSKLKLKATAETLHNPNGICVVTSNDEHDGVLACPGLQVGVVKILLLNGGTDAAAAAPRSIEAHKSSIAALALDRSGTRVATMSDSGTIIRVFNTMNGELIHELRRGKDTANIYSLCFNKEGNHLLCSSDKGTVHIFAVNHVSSKDVKEEKKIKNTTSLFSFAGGYFNSEWSFCQFHLPEELKGVRHVAMFGPGKEYIIYILCYNGSCYTIQYDPDQASTQVKIINKII